MLGAEGGRPGGVRRKFYCPRPGRGFRMVWVWEVYEGWMGQGSLQSLLRSTPQARGCFSLSIKPLMLIVLFTLQPSEDCVKNVSRTRPPEHPTPAYSQFLWNQQMGICCGAPAGLASLRPEACKNWMPGCNQRPPPPPHSNLHILDSVWVLRKSLALDTK